MRPPELPLFLAILPVLFSLQAIADSKASPYRSQLAPEWKIKTSTPEITIWERTPGHSSLVSAALLPLPRNLVHLGKRDKSNSSLNRQPIPLSRIQPFLDSRATKMKQTGFRNWRVFHADQITIPAGRSALELQGTYSAASGATLCFVERQITLSHNILQLTATEKKRGDCGWTMMSDWLSRIEPTKN